MATDDPASGALLERRANGIERLVSRYEAARSDGPVPEWILPPASCNFLKDLASLFPEPSLAIEFGSGCSTHALRAATSRTFSVEHSGDWLDQTESDKSSRRPSDATHVVPLRRLWNRGRRIETFDFGSRPAILDAVKAAQMILVDSPPNPAKREHALFTALRYASIGAIVILDDLEVRAVKRFSQRLAMQNRHTFRFWQVAIDHQLGVFLRTGSGRIHSRPSLREFVGTWLRV
jgi:hypothetical protein